MPIPRITLYTKPNCPLCDEALEQIEIARQRVACELSQVNILSDPATYERYQHEIPVVLLDGKEIFRYRLTTEALLEILCGETR